MGQAAHAKRLVRTSWLCAIEFEVMKAIGFDFGETLIYYRGTPLSWKPLYPAALSVVARSCHYTASSACIDKASLILEEYNTRINPRTTEVSSDVIINRVLECWGLPASQHLNSATQNFFAFFQQQVAIYDDSLTVLKLLKRKGIKTGILTDVPYGMKKEFVEHDLRSVGILSHDIHVLLTSVDVGQRKPDPTGYIRLAHELGVEPGEMTYVGNEKKDIEGANEAGAYPVLIARDGEFHEWGQQQSIKSLHEITRLI